MKKAIVTGITGQDGAYLTQLLLSKGYIVFGTYRRSSSVNFWRLKELGVYDNPRLNFIEFDLTDLSSAIRILDKYEPDEIYNLAAQSFVGVSFEEPITTAHITGVGALNLLEAIRIVNKSIKFYQASTSELFGKVRAIPQNELTPFYPRSPYAVAKQFAHWITVNYRESYGIFGCCGILFNHESPLRGQEFVTRKITSSVARIKFKQQECLELGNLNSKRDWGYAKDYVEGMWLLMQHSTPDSFVLATNRTTTVREFVIQAFQRAGIEIEFSGVGIDEVGKIKGSNRVVVKVNPEFFRPAEVDLLLGDYSKAKQELGWSPKVSVQELCDMMVDADIKRINANQILF